MDNGAAIVEISSIHWYKGGLLTKSAPLGGVINCEQRLRTFCNTVPVYIS